MEPACGSGIPFLRVTHQLPTLVDAAVVTTQVTALTTTFFPNLRTMSRLAAARQPQLTNEELEQLRESIQLFDQSKYKSSLKLAEALLAKHPDHAEALAVKALCQAQFASTQKASIELASRATRSNTRSFLCWHALAICNRKNRNYAEALRAYSQAAKIDPNNGMIVREVALMSTMLREYAPVIDLRLTSLRMMPHIRMSWIQLALAHHLAGSLPQALRVLEEYEATIKVRTLWLHESSRPTDLR